QDLHWLVAILLSQNRCSPMHPGQIRGLGAESPARRGAPGGARNLLVCLDMEILDIYADMGGMVCLYAGFIPKYGENRIIIP
ncbi:MAG: hypothetical protein LBK44_04405, partial [Spirochaetales bacterium]|nr:hypothetical protein [Spirochaetales bacterium]